jgi:exonuclease SbcD
MAAGILPTVSSRSDPHLGLMRILHTADWHLGRTLYHKSRYEEFQIFLDWLIQTIRDRAIDVLLIAGDVFDTTAPSNRAQELYYDFLSQLSATGCKHIVVTAGNHDSPTFLDAPKRILKALDVHVIGKVPDRIEDEVLLLRDRDGDPELIVCAVPYLRDRDIRKSETGESLEAKEQKLREGIEDHYTSVATIAVGVRDTLKVPVPIVAMGHLYTAGGQTVEGDGVRNLYVGNLAHVESKIFSDSFDYVALGHLHVPQKVNDSDSIRFSGSPIPMGFGEAAQQKYVNLVQWNENHLEVELIPVPKIQRLESIQGDWPHIVNRLEELKRSEESVWIEVAYRGSDLIPNLKEKVDPIIAGSMLEALRVTDVQTGQAILARGHSTESLKELNPIDIFRMYLDQKDLLEEQRKRLEETYHEILFQIQSIDSEAE